MATDFNGIGLISGDLKSYPEAIWTAEALPKNTNKSSSAFKLGQTNAQCEVKVVCQTGTTLGADLLIELQTSATEGGTYATEVSKTVAAGAIVAEDVLAGLILPKEAEGKLYSKVKLTLGAAETTGKVDAYIVRVPK